MFLREIQVHYIYKKAKITLMAILAPSIQLSIKLQGTHYKNVKDLQTTRCEMESQLFLVT